MSAWALPRAKYILIEGTLQSKSKASVKTKYNLIQIVSLSAVEGHTESKALSIKVLIYALYL